MTPVVKKVLVAGRSVLCMMLVALVAHAQQPGVNEPEKQDAARPPERIHLEGIENTFRLSPRLYSGGDPHGTKALTALKKLGIQSIVSVDGATPDVEAARRLGLRYVHLPIGYDGVPREQAIRIIKAVKSLPGPVYVHCHHGKHRGPAAAAVCGLATEGWTREQALAWLKMAGTSPNYRGLYASAREFVLPTAEELERGGNTFPERTKVPALVEMMVQVDERWDRINTVDKAGFKPPPRQPDIDPPHEALQLVEQFRELLRLPEAKGRGQEFLTAAEAAVRQATNLEEALRAFAQKPTSEARKSVEAAFLAAGKSCTTCHAAHRDN